MCPSARTVTYPMSLSESDLQELLAKLRFVLYDGCFEATLLPARNKMVFVPAIGSEAHRHVPPVQDFDRFDRSTSF